MTTAARTDWQFSGHGVQVASEVHPGHGDVVVLRSLDDAASGVIENALDATEWRGRRVAWSAVLEAEDVKGNAGLVVRAEREDGTTVALADMIGRGPRDSTAWQRYEVVLDVPDDAARIALGVERFGPGVLRCAAFSLDETAAEPLRQPAAPVMELPDTPAGRQLRWLLEAVSARTVGLGPDHLREQLAEIRLRAGTAPVAASLRRLGAQILPLSIQRADGARQHRASVNVRDASGQERSLWITVSSTEPHRITGWQALPYARRARRERPQLTKQGKSSRNRLIRTLVADAVRGLAKPFKKRSKAGIVVDADDRRAEVAALTTKIGVRIGTTQLRTRRADSAKREEAMEAAAMRSAEDVFKVMGSMKGAIMKVAQFASYTVDGLPQPIEQELSKLQQAAPPMTWELVSQVIASELGENAFAEIDHEPLASASIGQVHKATTHDGLAVAVKVQYPGVDQAIRADLKNAEMLMTSVSGMFGEGVDPKPILDEVMARAIEELDYRREAENQRWFADRYRGHPFVKVPAPVDDLSSERVLTTELVAGRRFYDVVGDPQDARNRFGEIVYRFALTSVFVDGVFSGDPHPGNYVFMDDGRVCFLDYGMVKHLESDHERELLRAPVAALLTGERSRLGDAIVAGLDEETEWTYFSGLFGLVLSDLPVRFTRAAVQEGMARSATPPGRQSPGQRRLALAPVLGVFTRYVYGTHAVLGHLEAEANWNRIVREVVLGDPPSTEIGEGWARAQRAGGTDQAWR